MTSLCPGCGHPPNLVCDACHEHTCIHGATYCADADIASTRLLEEDEL